MSRLRLFGLVSLMVTVGCTDPASDLGSDLLGMDQEPEVLPVAPTLFASKPFADITGQAARVLLGTVDDPLMGSMSATAALEFDLGFPDAAPEVTGAEIFLRRTYLYGDTTSMLTVAVHDILESWNATGVKADTTLVLGPQVTTHTFLSSDSTVTILMPQEWVSLYADTLEHAEADSLFHGLALVPVSGNAIGGYINTRIRLDLHSADDTTMFDYSTSVTMTQRQTEPALPEHRIAFQDATGPTVQLNFDFSGLDSHPINGAVLLVYVDTLAMNEAPMDFVRPVLNELNLVAVRDEDAPALLVSTAQLSDDGIYAFSGSDMAVFFYQVLFGVEEYLYLELRAPVLENSISSLVLHDVGAEQMAPELRLILGD